jgi:hypothetical protein
LECLGFIRHGGRKSRQHGVNAQRICRLTVGA